MWSKDQQVIWVPQLQKRIEAFLKEKTDYALFKMA